MWSMFAKAPKPPKPSMAKDGFASIRDTYGKKFPYEFSNFLLSAERQRGRRYTAGIEDRLVSVIEEFGTQYIPSHPEVINRVLAVLAEHEITTRTPWGMRLPSP